MKKMVTVKDLIDKLNTLDPQLPIMKNEIGYNGWREVCEYDILEHWKPYIKTFVKLSAKEKKSDYVDGEYKIDSNGKPFLVL